MTWARLRWTLGLGVAVAGAIGACGYPNFTYQSAGSGGGRATSSSSTGNTGGMGGASSSRTAVTIGSISSSTSTSSSGGGGAGVTAQVPCIDGSMCQPGQICCFNYSTIGCDECLDISGVCGVDQDQSCGGPSQYGRYNCNTNDDCDDKHGEVCCMNLVMDIDGNILAAATSCTANCTVSTGTRISCATKSDCPGNEDCQPVDFDYPGYGYCGMPAG